MREEFRLSPKPVQAAMGESAILECVAPKGHPDPAVRWRKDGEYINTNKGRFHLAGPGNLVINDVRQSDEGHYRCVAENVAGIRESLPAAMTVHGELNYRFSYILTQIVLIYIITWALQKFNN